MTDATPYDSDRVNRESDEIVALIKPLLAGRHPGIQGCALADLLAIWLAGYPESVEGELIDAHVRGVRQLVGLYRGMRKNDHAARN